MKAVVKTVEPAEREARFDHIRPHYLEALTLVERLHRRLLDVIKDEFDRRGRADINSVQALLLYNIGDKELTAGELRTRGYYLGSNVSYNLKKLVEMGFLDHQRSRVDRRSVRIKLTDKGREVRDTVDALYQKHVKTVEQVTFSGAYATRTQQPVLYITERAVFELREGVLTLTEIAPGVDLERDILAQMDFMPAIALDLKPMPAELFHAKWGGLRQHLLAKQAAATPEPVLV